MPTHYSKDSEGCFAQWGSHGKKYYYKCNDKEARQRAGRKADTQGRAIHSQGKKSIYSTGFKGKI